MNKIHFANCLRQYNSKALIHHEHLYSKNHSSFNTTTTTSSDQAEPIIIHHSENSYNHDDMINMLDHPMCTTSFIRSASSTLHQPHEPPYEPPHEQLYHHHHHQHDCYHQAHTDTNCHHRHHIQSINALSKHQSDMMKMKMRMITQQQNMNQHRKKRSAIEMMKSSSTSSTTIEEQQGDERNNNKKLKLTNNIANNNVDQHIHCTINNSNNTNNDSNNQNKENMNDGSLHKKKQSSTTITRNKKLDVISEQDITQYFKYTQSDAARLLGVSAISAMFKQFFTDSFLSGAHATQAYPLTIHPVRLV